MTTDIERQDALMQRSFESDQAAYRGSPSSRDRRLCSNCQDGAENKTVPPVPPASLLPEDVEPVLLRTMPVMPCIVAAEQTRNPPLVRSRLTGDMQQLSADEKDVMQGMPPGHSDGGWAPYTNGPLLIDESTRAGLAGRAFNQYQVHAHFSCIKIWDVANPMPLAHFTTQLEHMNTDQLELYLANMTQAELEDYFREGPLKDYEPPELYIEVSKHEGVPYQTKYDFASGNIEEDEYQFNIEIEKGRMERCEYSANAWISSAFTQDKKRLHPGTEYKVKRPLVALQYANAALMRSPDHWVTMFPTVEGMMSSIPVDAGCFLLADYDTAFGSVKVAEECRHLLVALFNGKLYRYCTMPQGLSTSALFYNCFMINAFNTALSK